MHQPALRSYAAIVLFPKKHIYFVVFFLIQRPKLPNLTFTLDMSSSTHGHNLNNLDTTCEADYIPGYKTIGRLLLEKIFRGFYNV